MNKSIMIASLFFCQMVVPSDSVSNRTKLTQALLTTTVNVAVALLNKKGERRYKEAYNKRYKLAIASRYPNETSLVLSTTRNILTVLSGADKVKDTDNPPRLYRAWSCIPGFASVASITGLSDIFNKKKPTTTTGNSKSINMRLTRWNKHKQLLSLLTTNEEPYAEAVHSLIDSLPDTNNSEFETFLINSRDPETNTPIQNLTNLFLSPDTTEYIWCDQKNLARSLGRYVVLYMHKNTLYRITLRTRYFTLLPDIKAIKRKRLIDSDLAEILTNFKAAKALCYVHKNDCLPDMPSDTKGNKEECQSFILPIIASYL